MPALAIQGFDGVYPRTSPTMLGDSQAQQADDVKLYAGELRYWRGPLLTYTPVMSNIHTIFRIDNLVASDSRWLTWQTDVNAVRGPLSDPTDELRIYYTGDGVPKKTNWALASTGAGPYPAASLNLGVPAPTTAPAVTAIVGSSIAETRAYVYTYVSQFGTVLEESAPSPAALITLTAGQAVHLASFAAPPTTGYNIISRRIYRSVTTSNGGDYSFVVEVPLAIPTYDDNLSVTALGATLTTVGWTPPPARLTGLVAMVGGVLAGFVGNTVYFSEPYQPHAWPLSYALSFPDRIVGLGAYGQSLAVMTDKYPQVLTGPYPGAYSPEKIEILEPCVSKRSIATNEQGVYYASPNGLMNISASSGLQTTQLFRRDEWQAIGPTTMAGVFYDQKYIGVRNGDPALVIGQADRPALAYHTIDATCAYVDALTAQLYYVSATDGKIYEDDASELNATNYTWKSKRFMLPTATSFSAITVDAAYDQITDSAAYNAQVAAIAAQNAIIFAGPLHGEINGSALLLYPVAGSAMLSTPSLAASRSAQIVLSSDGTDVATISPTSIQPIRIPSFRGHALEMKITGNINVRSVKLATTVPELYT